MRLSWTPVTCAGVWVRVPLGRVHVSVCAVRACVGGHVCVRPCATCTRERACGRVGADITKEPLNPNVTSISDPRVGIQVFN